jgi:hypothetical protein
VLSVPTFRVSLLVLALAVTVGCGSERRGAPPLPSPVPSPSGAPTPSGTPTVTPRPSASPTASPTATPSAPTTARSLRNGDRGPRVLVLQRELGGLGYWLGTPDGVYGDLTEQAVLALQKAAGLSRDGRVGPQTTSALRARVRPHSLSTSGRVVEIDLQRQLLLVVQDGLVLRALNTSTGSGGTYWYHGGARRAVTPRGHFEVYGQIDGLRVSPLGLLWRPKYFNGGIAVHGSPSVPPWPASHGCVRLSYPAMDMIWADGLMPLGTAVWVR